MNFKSQNNEIYNKDFNLDELVEAIQLSHDSATGPDEIHYQMLKHLPDTSLETLLNIFNYIWTTGKFPEDWTLATIIPIPKPGKDPAEPNNYRPIALTSCLCKTLERMINKRLTWFLESNNHISRFQSGFRSDRSTTDNLVRLETFIRDAFIKKEHVVAVFFDLEKAYDTTWRYGISKDIHKLGLRGRLPTFIENFLADRAMQVRVGSSLSDYYDQEQGVPQGGVLSTTLFSIKINDIVKCLGNLTDCSLYVDDFCICYRSKSMATIERQLQQNLNKIENWATSNGFKFSKSKTQCVHFCQLREEMKENLKSQGVTSVKRIIIKKEGKHIETNTFVLTFNTPIVPKDIKIFYRNIKIELYIPNPLRCFWCQKFGHHEDKCSAPPVCGKCGQEGNHASTCSNPIKCANCGKDHPAYSNQCEVWLKEKEIIKLKVKNNITYPEARKLYEALIHPGVNSYASIIKNK